MATTDLILNILTVLVLSLGAYFTYVIYKYNRLNKSWLALTLALIIAAIRRTIILATALGYFPILKERITQFDAIILLISAILYTYGLWSMKRSFETFEIVEKKTQEKIERMMTKRKR